MTHKSTYFFSLNKQPHSREQTGRENYTVSNWNGGVLTTQTIWHRIWCFHSSDGSHVHLLGLYTM